MVNFAERSRNDIAMDVYTAFRNSGFSDAQARALTAEINRENSLRPSLLFGSHSDPYNKATNVGMLSWQGSRAPKVMKYLEERGLITDKGTIQPSFEAIQAQTDYIRKEMEENPSYSKTVEEFLSNPDVDPETASRVLGDNYIRWRRTDPKYSKSGYDRIAEGYKLLASEELSGSYNPPRLSTSSGVEPTASEELYGMFGDVYATPEERAAADAAMLKQSTSANRDVAGGSTMDYLSDALEYLDLSQLAGGVKPPSSVGPGIYRPRGGGGSRALQRFGIASLA